MTKITLPGSIPGLLRRGSPIKTIAGINKWEGVVIEIESEDWIRVGGIGVSELVYSSYLLLDLEDPTGRQHAIWWLASKYCTKLINFEFFPGMKAVNKRGDIVYKYWCLQGSRSMFMVRYWDRETEEINEGIVVKGLEYIDWENELEALRRICLHVAGL